MVYEFFDIKSSATHKGKAINSECQKLVQELHKPTIRKFKKWKTYSSFTDNIWGADLADM